MGSYGRSFGAVLGALRKDTATALSRACTRVQYQEVLVDHLGRKALVLALEDDEPAHGSSLDLAVDRMKQASKPGASRSGRANVSERGQ